MVALQTLKWWHPRCKRGRVGDGIDVGSMDATLLKKIEELTLYVLDLKKENEEIKRQLGHKN
jgi:hypothetical protein